MVVWWFVGGLCNPMCELSECKDREFWTLLTWWWSKSSIKHKYRMQNKIGIKQTCLDYDRVYSRLFSLAMFLRCWCNADRRKTIPADLVTYLRISRLKPASCMFGGYVPFSFLQCLPFWVIVFPQKESTFLSRYPPVLKHKHGETPPEFSHEKTSIGIFQPWTPTGYAMYAMAMGTSRDPIVNWIGDWGLPGIIKTDVTALGPNISIEHL